MQIHEFLKEPFDYFNTNKNKWLYVIATVCFALLFLSLFQPYGIAGEIENPQNPLFHKFLFFFSIAVSSFIALSVSQFLLRNILGYQNVSVKKYMFWLLFEAFILLFVNFGMSFIIPDLGNDFEQELSLWFQLKMYPKVLMVLLFPFMGSIVYIAIKRMYSEIKELGHQLQEYKHQYESFYKLENILFLDENNQPDITLPVKNVLYIESSNQYVLIHYKNNGTFKKHIIRNRLKHIVGQTALLPIKQCHRSFAVNLIHVKYLVRKSGKPFLVIDAIAETIKIPVSNSFLEAIRKELQD
ncbi:MAG: LytTR family DNA-binding domain-containing protein [Aestuariibaculum sp.]